MELVQFSVINQYHKERLLHPSRYSGKDHSFLKIFQHALSFALTKQKKKLIKTYFGYPYIFQLLVYKLKSLKRKKNQESLPLKEYVILDPGRVVKGNDDQWHSIYFDTIGKLISREKLTLINKKKDAGIPFDYEIDQFDVPHPFPDANERNMLKDVLIALRSAKKSGQFIDEEMRQITSAMHIFYDDFRFYYNLFKDQPTKSLLFICHYHNEGLIASLKTLNISCIEIQHGLIASNDLYYVYHEQFASVISRSFFPDKVLVYGPYWKRILEIGCEFRSHQITIAGDYLYRLSDIANEVHAKENIILICAQKNLDEDYLIYGKALSAHMKKHPEWRAILKLHPLEKNKVRYEELKEYGIELVDVETQLDILLSKSKIQISIYSTTFYDARGFDVVNFSIQDFGSMSDYAADMIREGVAEPIHIEEDPIEKYFELKNNGLQTLKRDDVYAILDERAIREAIAS